MSYAMPPNLFYTHIPTKMFIEAFIEMYVPSMTFSCPPYPFLELWDFLFLFLLYWSCSDRLVFCWAEYHQKEVMNFKFIAFPIYEKNLETWRWDLFYTGIWGIVMLFWKFQLFHTDWNYFK